MELLDLSSTASYGLILLDLQDASAVCALDVLPVAFTVLLEVFVDVEEELFDLGARVHVLSEEARADAEVERLLGFLLLGALLEAAALSTEAQFDHLRDRRQVLAAL